MTVLPMGDNSPSSSTVSQATKMMATSSVEPTAKVVTSLFTQPIEEQPSATLVDAVALVARAVTAKIAYHQDQINALRRALRPFNEMSKHSEFPLVAGSDDAVEQLLAIAKQLGSPHG